MGRLSSDRKPVVEYKGKISHTGGNSRQKKQQMTVLA